MATHLYLTDHTITAGSTMRDSKALADGNMAMQYADNPEEVVINRQRLAERINIPLDHFVFPAQTHSTNVHCVTQTDHGAGARDVTTAIADCDALYSFASDVALGVLTADCVPILFYACDYQLIGAIHSGWRGTVQEISKRTIQHIVSENPQVNPQAIHAIIGPALSKTHFEVQEDVFTLFDALGYCSDFISYVPKDKRWHIDNQAVVKCQLQQAGLLDEHITMIRHCTYAHENSFSYRRNQTKGRHYHFIAQKSLGFCGVW